MIEDLFQDQIPALPEQQQLGQTAWLLRKRLHLHELTALFSDIKLVITASPLRHMVTRGGHEMSVATTSCGAQDWISDATHGYRYIRHDPLNGQPWPSIPTTWMALAERLAMDAGFRGFRPDTALVNAYAPGTQMGLHQDRDEATLDWPVVSISLGLPARFAFGGLARSDAVEDVPLMHGDIVAWGGEDRLRFHGIRPLQEGFHPLTGRWRYNLTFRRVHP